MTLRLVHASLEHWADLDGYAVAHNVGDLRELPLDRFCSFVRWWFTRNIESEAELAKFEARLWQPPMGVAPANGSPWSPEKENESLKALKASLGK